MAMVLQKYEVSNVIFQSNLSVHYKQPCLTSNGLLRLQLLLKKCKIFCTFKAMDRFAPRHPTMLGVSLEIQVLLFVIDYTAVWGGRNKQSYL